MYRRDDARVSSVVRPDGYASPLTTVHLLHPGYTGDRVGSSVVLVRDGDALIIVDSSMVARSLITDPLAAPAWRPMR
jgi:hypothetical protein